MHDHFGLRSVRQPMPLAPREVVMVLDVEQHLDAERLRDVRVNQRVIGGGIPAHQLHGRPVLLSGLGGQIEPRELRQLPRQLRMERSCETAVVLRHLRTGAAAPGMAEECEVRSGRQAGGLVKNGELAELDEVVAAPARAELSPRTILHPGGDGRDSPVTIHDLVVARRSKRGAHPEPRFPFQCPGQAGLVVLERSDRKIEDRHLHPARDVDADGVRDDGFVRGQDTADGQSVADVCVRHEGAGDGHRQLAGVLQLLHGVGLEVGTPDLIGSLDRSRLERIRGHTLIVSRSTPLSRSALAVVIWSTLARGLHEIVPKIPLRAAARRHHDPLHILLVG